MSNRSAAVIAFVLLCLGLADVLFNGAGLLTFGGQQLIRVTEWLAFWR